jgi:heme o synthase
MPELVSLGAAWQAYLDLTKPRIAAMIVVSTAVGYYFGQDSGFAFWPFFHAVIGTALMAAGSATLNQWYERDIDARMQRTRKRPLPSGIVTPNQAFWYGVALSVAGLAQLAVFANLLAALLGLLTAVGYLFLYTPLKRHTPMCTTIGALPGATPPLIGYAASHGHLALEAWILFGILFLWQFPHFHAIAWMYREDYQRGGIRMLAVVQPDGKAVSRRILATLVLLIPLTIWPALLHPAMAGTPYLIVAVVLSLTFLWFGIRIVREKTYARARQLLLASVIYLPVLFAFLILNRP